MFTGILTTDPPYTQQNLAFSPMLVVYPQIILIHLGCKEFSLKPTSLIEVIYGFNKKRLECLVIR